MGRCPKPHKLFAKSLTKNLIVRHWAGGQVLKTPAPDGGVLHRQPPAGQGRQKTTAAAVGGCKQSLTGLAGWQNKSPLAAVG